MAWSLHLSGRMPLPRLLVAVLVSSSTLARADCPTRTDDLPAAGFLASMTRAVLAPEAGVEPAVPAFRASVGIAGGMRADSLGGPQAGDAALMGTGGLSGEVAVHRRSGLAACASANVLDVRTGAARIMASTHVPLLFTGLGIGVSVDRDVMRPLSSRHDLWRAPVRRLAVQFSIAFLDLDLVDGANTLRLAVAPSTVEQGVTSQDATSVILDRRTIRVDTSMFRIAARGPDGNGALDLFRIDVDWTESTMMPLESDLTGYMRFSPLMLRVDGDTWSWELDGGLLALDGPIDCEVVRCARGFYKAALRRTGRLLSVDGRAERAAFIAADNLPTLEDRLSVTAALRLRGDRLQANATGFVAATESIVRGDTARRGGVRATLSHALGHGFAGLLDAEVVQSTSTAPELASAARVLVSLAWLKETTR